MLSRGGSRSSRFAPASRARATSRAILIVSDAEFRATYALQASTVACYARRQGYEFYQLDPDVVAPLCAQHHPNFFFRKHCTVRQWLRGQVPGRAALVIDGDTVGGLSPNSLGRWLDVDDFDVGFYERAWNNEIMAGGYLLRNTPFTQRFLQAWANYEFVQPTGFTSHDNGAIHLVILDALLLRGRENCFELFRQLSENTSTAQQLYPYFRFVACAQRLIGPPRTHSIFSSKEEHSLDLSLSVGNEVGRDRVPAAKITIFPRFFGFSLDGAVFGLEDSRLLHPFFHNEKDSIGVRMKYSVGPDGCPGPGKKRFGEEQFGKKIQMADKLVLNYNGLAAWDIVPRWRYSNESCCSDLWCPPLPAGFEGEWPVGNVKINGSVSNTTYEYPGVDWFNPMVSASDSYFRAKMHAS